MARLRDHLRHAKPYVAIAGPTNSAKTRLADALAEHFAGRKIASPRLPAGQPAAAASGRALAWELELLAERGSLLAARTWPDDAILAVSDFWFDQSLAYGRLRLDAGEFIELRNRHQALTQTVVPPKLVVLLTSSAAHRPSAEPSRAGIAMADWPRFRSRLRTFGRRLGASVGRGQRGGGRDVINAKTSFMHVDPSCSPLPTKCAIAWRKPARPAAQSVWCRPWGHCTPATPAWSMRRSANAV